MNPVDEVGIGTLFGGKRTGVGIDDWRFGVNRDSFGALGSRGPYPAYPVVAILNLPQDKGGGSGQHQGRGWLRLNVNRLLFLDNAGRPTATSRKQRNRKQQINAQPDKTGTGQDSATTGHHGAPTPPMKNRA
jgi:hypothetical protein